MMQGSRFSGHLRVAVVGVASAVAVAATSCAPGPTTPGPPVIHSFAATRTAGPAPLTTTFTWNVSDPESDPLSCALDTDGDGTFEIEIPHCSSAVARAVTFDTPGTRSARLRISDGTDTVSSTPLSVTAGAASVDLFTIDVAFDPSMTTAQKQVFQAAADRWSEVIRTGLPDTTVDVEADDCGTGAPAHHGPVDDLLIEASVVTIDGAGGVLGRAGPCLVRTGGGLPAYGTMEFDAADVTAMADDGTFSDVILHEMGHVIGIGTRWDGLLSGSGTSDPRFVGMTARGALSAMSGGDAEPVPVEATGGGGTAGAHWRESVFGDELMTGWISIGPNPLSRVTAGGLADLGYGVDLAAADELPMAALRRPAAPARRLDEQVIMPIGTVG